MSPEPLIARNSTPLGFQESPDGIAGVGRALATGIRRQISGASGGGSGGRGGRGGVASAVPSPGGKPNGTGDPPSSEFTKEELKNHLTWFIEGPRKGLKEIFFPDGITDKMAEAAAKMGNELCKKGCGKEIAEDLTLLTLYDVVLLIDDSRSMEREEKGQRIETLKKALNYIARVVQLAKKEGIKAIRFLNFADGYVNVVPRMTATIIQKHTFRHWSRIGTELKSKIIDKHVFGEPMARPLLVITITDGDAEGEAKNVLVSVIDECIKKLMNNHGPNGADAIGFQFAKVGNDQKAETLLKKLDNDPTVGSYVDSFPVGIEVFAEKDNVWPAMPKLLLGGIVGWWDTMEKHADKPTRKLDGDGVAPEDKGKDIQLDGGEETDDDETWG